jgi:hypothetical protein
MEEKKFPIYNFSFRWNQDNYENNGSSFSKMYKEEPTENELRQDLENSKQYREKKQIEEGHPVTEWLEVEYKYIEHESWVLIWFNHMTYNQFETDAEVEESFKTYINRMKRLNMENGHSATEMNYSQPYDSNKPFHCLMGAEDHWRWNICRCEHCQAQGKITIDH